MPRDARRGLSPYEAILGDAYHALHPHVQEAHQAPLRATGAFDVVHGSHYLVPILVRLMKLPAAGAGVPVDLRVVSEPATAGERSLGVLWMRRIGRSTLVTQQRARSGYLVEQSRRGRVVFSLRAVGGCLGYEHASMRFLWLPVPLSASPRVRAWVSPDAQGWRVEVVVEWRGHLVCRYWGTMRPVRATP